MIGGQGTWSAVLGPAGASNPGYWTTGDQTLPGGAKTFTGGPWTFTRTAQSGSETIATFKISDDASNYLTFINGSGTDSRYDPFIRGVVNSTQSALILQGLVGSDSGSAAAIAFDVRTGGGATLSSKTLFGLLNNNTTVFSILPLNSGANSCLSWGTQAGAVPAFTTRSTGTRIVLHSAVDSTHADNAIGVEASGVAIWYGVQQANSSYYHRWFGGTTQLAILDGAGKFFLNANGSAASFRFGQRLAVDASATYGGAGFSTWSTTAAECTLIDINRSKSATVGTYTVVASGDQLGAIGFRGADGSGFVTGASISAEVDGTPGSSDMPGRLLLKTTPDGSSSATERMRITNAGDVGIGKTPTTGITLDLNGRLGLKSYTVGTLPSAATQAGAIIYVSDAAGTPCVALSDGTNWKRCDDCSVTVS